MVKKFSESSDVISVGYANGKLLICLTYSNLAMQVADILTL